MLSVADPLGKHAQKLRGTWQGRALAVARGKTAATLLSVLAHNYDEALLTLLQTVFPGFRSITAPFLCTAGKISKTGAVIADVIQRDGTMSKQEVLYPNVTAFQNDFRRLADRLKLTDDERREMFVAMGRWLVCDYRLDPTMDPQDPDAKRLVVH